MKLTIEAGKSYRLNDGKVVEVEDLDIHIFQGSDWYDMALKGNPICVKYFQRVVGQTIPLDGHVYSCFYKGRRRLVHLSEFKCEIKDNVLEFITSDNV